MKCLLPVRGLETKCAKSCCQSGIVENWPVVKKTKCGDVIARFEIHYKYKQAAIEVHSVCVSTCVCKCVCTCVQSVLYRVCCFLPHILLLRGDGCHGGVLIGNPQGEINSIHPSLFGKGIKDLP